MKAKTINKWICTNPSSNQWGRMISENIFEFKKDIKYPDGNINKVGSVIHLRDYTSGQRQNYLYAFGYNLDDLYRKMDKDDVNWLVAECIFEMTI